MRLTGSSGNPPGLSLRLRMQYIKDSSPICSFQLRSWMMKILTTHPRWSYSAQTKRYQNTGTKNLLKRVYTSLYRFRVRLARHNVCIRPLSETIISLAAVLGKRSRAADDLNSALHLKLVKTTPDMGKLDNYGFLQQNLTQKSLDDCPAPVSLLYDGFGYFMYDLQSSG